MHMTQVSTSRALAGQPVLPARRPTGSAARRPVRTTAFFKRAVVAEPEPVAPPKKGLFGFLGPKKEVVEAPVKKGAAKKSASKSIDKAAELK